jgi:O-antigen/teichoic acid export membrane protein
MSDASKEAGALAEADAAQRRLLAEGSIYAVVDVVQQGISVLMVPLFFYFLSVNDFGVITTSVMVSQVTMLLSTMGLDFSLLRLYYVWPKEHRTQLTSGVLYVSAIWSLAVGLGVVALLNGLFRGESYRESLVLGAGAGLALGLRSIPLSVIRVTGVMRTYAIAEVGGAVGRSVCQLVLVWVGFGAQGYMAGYALGPLISGAVGLISTRSVFDWRQPKWRLTREIWIYTWNVLPSLVFNRFLAIVDRLVLFVWTDLDALGIYGAASRFSNCLKFMTGGFKLAVAPALSRTKDGSIESAKTYSSISRLLLLTMLLIGSALMVAAWFIQFTPWAERWIEVQRLASILLFAQLLSGFGLIWQLGFYYSPKPQAVSIAAAGSAIALLIGLLVLVPLSGIMGAAIAQAVAAFVNILILAGVEAKEKGHLETWHELFVLTGLFVPTVAAAWVLRPNQQLYVLLPTLLIYALVTGSSIRQLWQPKAVSV